LAVRLELRAKRARKRRADAHDLLELVERNRAAPAGAFLDAARQREAIQEARARRLRLGPDADAARRRAHGRLQRTDQPLVPAPQRAVQLLTVGALDPLCHVRGRHAAEEVDLDRDRTVPLRCRERRPQERRLAEPPRALETTVAGVQRPLHEDPQLIVAIDEIGRIHRFFVDERTRDGC
jgi:hypothetical protein